MHVKTNLYVGSLDAAYDLICERAMTHCDPIAETYWLYTVDDGREFLLFALSIGIEHWVGDNTMLIPERRVADAEAAIEHYEISAYKDTRSLFFMEVWGEEDEAVLDATFA